MLATCPALYPATIFEIEALLRVLGTASLARHKTYSSIGSLQFLRALCWWGNSNPPPLPPQYEALRHLCSTLSLRAYTRSDLSLVLGYEETWQQNPRKVQQVSLTAHHSGTSSSRLFPRCFFQVLLAPPLLSFNAADLAASFLLLDPTQPPPTYYIPIILVPKVTLISAR